MLKGEFLFTRHAHENLITLLQEAGVAHIDFPEDITSDALENLREKQERIHRAIETINGFEKSKDNQKKGAAPQNGSLSDLQIEDQPEGAPLDHLLQQFEERVLQLKTATQEKEKDALKYATNRNWGDIDPEAIEKLAAEGVRLRYYSAPKAPFYTEQKKGNRPPIHIVSEDTQVVRFFTLNDKGEISPPPYPFARDVTSEISIIPLQELKERYEKSIDQEDKARSMLNPYTSLKPFLEKELVKIKNHLLWLQGALMADSPPDGFEPENDREPGGPDQTVPVVKSPILYLQVWVPAENKKELESALCQHNISAEVDPARSTIWHQFNQPEDDENPPVLLRNNTLAEPFETITGIFSLPNYRELDPTPFFAPFFAMFFGLCVADFGYALIATSILFTYSFFAPKRFKKIVKLGVILGLATAAGGVVLNTAMGAPLFIDQRETEGFIHGNPTLHFLSPYKQGGSTVFPAMNFSLMVGVLQVCTGIALQITNRMRQKKFAEAIQPISYLILIPSLVLAGFENDVFSMQGFHIGRWTPWEKLQNLPDSMGLYTGGFALLLLVFFNNPDKSIWLRPPMALWELYNFSTGLAGDILSYLRLFALGLAGGLLGGAFNNIGLMLVDFNEQGEIVSGPITVAAMIAVWIIGHTLNIALSFLGGFVHSLRLTFVEFYKHLQFKGGGKPYTPFLKQGLERQR